MGSITLTCVAAYMNTAQTLRLLRLEAKCFDYLLAHLSEVRMCTQLVMANPRVR